MAALPISNPPKSVGEWSGYVEKAKKDIDGNPNAPEPKPYDELDQSDHPSCQVVIGFREEGVLASTGFVECGAKLVRRVFQVPDPR